MHMNDALITPLVGGTMLMASSAAIGYSIRKIKEETVGEKISLMGVMGAFLFAVQMINFAIPGTGSSGHIGGGILLSIILGPAEGFLTMACVLFIQALFFADGGLLAFGCNLMNLGFFAAFVAYPLFFKPILRNKFTKRRLMLAAIISSIIGLQLGSFGVVLETVLSGRTELPLGTFLLFMQPIHLIIGLIEGIITGIIVVYLYNQNENMIYVETKKNYCKKSKINITLKILLLAAIVGGIVSLLASNLPDGLEWAVENVAGTKELTSKSNLIQKFEQIQNNIAFFPDYTFRSKNEIQGVNLSGIIGSILVLLLTTIGAFIIRKFRKEKSYE